MFAETAGTVRDTGVSLAMTSRLYYASLAFVGALGTAAVYWLGARAVINGTLTSARSSRCRSTSRGCTRR